MKRKILFVRPAISSFTEADRRILEKHYEIRLINFGFFKKDPANFVLNFLRILKGAVVSDIVFVWFAGLHALPAIIFSRMLGKKSIVVLGGYEVAKVPEIGYGAALNRRSARIVKFVIEHANVVLTVDESLRSDAIRNLVVSGENIRTIPTGYDYDRLKFEGKKEKLVVTVGSISHSVVKRKGFETFINSAKYLPDVKFALIGKHIDDSIHHLKSMAPPNVEFPGFVSDEELLNWYRRAKVYCQLSRYEGLPNALCEAMLCECVPVGTNYCGIPTAIGDTGFYVPYGDEKATADAIRRALSSENGPRARDRIVKHFSIEERERKLVGLIEQLVEDG